MKYGLSAFTLLLPFSTSLAALGPFELESRDYGDKVLEYLSAARAGDETRAQERERKEDLLRELPRSIREQLLAPVPENAPSNQAIPYTDLVLDDLPRLPPEYGPLETFQWEYEARRDERFMKDPERSHGDFLRRITWLFPDDGCFSRSLLMSKGLEEEGLARPLTLFVFPRDPDGWLYLETPWSPRGYVQWSWHVVPAVLSEGQLTVLDAAIDPTGPMSVEEWLLSFLPSVEDAKVAVCDEYALMPTGTCWNSPQSNDAMARYYETTYMTLEWTRVSRLGYDPYELLGDAPPWLEESPE